MERRGRGDGLDELSGGISVGSVVAGCRDRELLVLQYGYHAADLQGSIDYLAQHGATSIGVYSTASQWNAIAGSAPGFTTTPNWVPGASSARQAPTLCAASFTGGPVQLVQYPAGKFDGDITC